MTEHKDMTEREGSICEAEEEARRDFLKKFGAYSLVTPPAMVMMLNVTSKPAHAAGSGRGSGKGRGEGGGRGHGRGRGQDRD
jgi:hypothetical protein